MAAQETSYKQIMKATSIFGGVQVLTIIISIIKSKVVAVLLGTAGMGVLGLFQTTINLIQSVTGLGLSSSAVRDISEANGTEDKYRIALVVKTIRRWVWLTGLFGASVTLSLSHYLSKWTFGSEEYTWSFVWLSVICLLTAISSGQNVILQGMRRLKQMAQSTLYGSILGLLTSLPLFYYYGIKGIIPSLIVTAVSTLLISYYFASKIKIEKVEQKWADTYKSGLDIAKLGFIMMLSSFMVTLVSYVVTLFISNQDGVSEVGLYRAGWIICTQYTGLIFTAMGTDYYPRLAAINSDNKKLEEAVNQQAEIAILLLGIMLVALIGFVPFIVKLFYTSQFTPIIGMIKWTMIGILFKSASWALGFTIIAKGDKKLFFVSEVIANSAILFFNLLGYHFFGLDGIGISFGLSYFLHFLLISYLVRRSYNIYYQSTFWKLFAFQSSFVIAALLLSTQLQSILHIYIAVSILLLGVSFFSFVELNKRIKILDKIKQLKK